MNEKSSGIVIAIFLGWLGGYRFYKKQYILGFIYFLTGGLCSIGWIVDIILACTYSDEPKTMDIPKSSNSNLEIITEFYTKVVGVTYPCLQGAYDTRQEALENLRYKDTLLLEFYKYEGEPAYRVYNKRNFADIGNLKAELAKELYRKYPDCWLDIIDFDITEGEGKNLGCNIKIRVTKIHYQ